jgi:PPOX class probable F420-dependent enzyme
MSDWPFNPGEQRYVSLATYRRNGVEVRTPVWIAESEGKYYLFSAGEAGKVKRLRANGKVRLAACDSRGKIRSEWLDAEGRIIVDDAHKKRAYKALRRKYGWQMKMIDFFSRFGGRYNKRAIIELDIIA